MKTLLCAGRLSWLACFLVLLILPFAQATADPAADRMRGLMHGANLGNLFEVPPSAGWEARYELADLQRMYEEGFDHVRIPVGWHHYLDGESGRLKPSIYSRVDPWVDEALKVGLHVIVNIHHFDAFTSNPQEKRGELISIWKQLSTHYIDRSQALVYEIINEPKDAATTQVMNGIYPDVIKAIRAVDPDRSIMLGPGRWNQVSELKHLDLPDDLTNIIVTIHCYEPFLFTHQGASWTGATTRLTGIKFPGPPDAALKVAPGTDVPEWVLGWVERYNRESPAFNPSGPGAFVPLLEQAAAWGKIHNRPIHVGEFGAYTRADGASRANYYRAFRQACEHLDLGWAVWDWGAGFRYWNRANQAPEPGMKEALFGE